MRKRRRILLLIALSLVASGLVVGAAAPPVVATPVATSDELYQLYGRVFPDPHGCVRGQPNVSPWAKGEVCAGQFAQWSETLAGLRFLESKFSRYMQLINLRTMLGDHPAFESRNFLSAGLPQADLSRDRRDLYVIKLTDRQSPVQEADRKHFAYSLSIHGIERAGLEGGIRAVEDLVTWAACEDDPEAAPGCATEGPFPKRILEPSDSGPTAGEVLDNGVVYFVFSNPDGWNRGEATEGRVFYQRYNGNGMDLNRDWASIGYTEPQYTPFSEPESQDYAAYLSWVKDQTTAGKFDGAIDLHGMVTARAFSFTLLGAGQRDYRKNVRSVETSISTFRDSEARLSWSPLIAPREECPVLRQNVGVLVSEAAAQMCSDQWGTVWDTINYQVTGSFGDWMDSPLGLNAVGIDNEMALSHLAPNNTFDPGLEQLHIDGNKGLIYSQIASLLFEEPVTFQPGGKVAYVFDPQRVSHPGAEVAQGNLTNYPTQDDIEALEISGEGVEFEVKGPEDGVYNGGLSIEATCTNAQGIAACTGSGVAGVAMILDYCGPPEHIGDPEGCTEVARYFNQSPIYSQAGARIDLNNPRAGPYRIRPAAARVGPVRYEITFSRDSSYPEPEQAPYDASLMDFFTDLNRYTPEGGRLKALSVDDILATPSRLGRFDSVVVANDFMPGAEGYEDVERQAYATALSGFASGGGNLVLTDAAVGGLSALGTGIEPSAVKGGFFYAGWMDFDDGQGPTYDRHPLAAGVNMEGTAEGIGNVGEVTFDNRHQTYEPVPLGYYVGPGGSGNAACTSDKCDSPNWIVDEAAWTAAGGTVAAKTLVRETTEPGSAETTGVSLGELPFGEGVIRIGGALLPDPTEENHHPFGLASYALTYTGYQVFENLIRFENPNRAEPAVDLTCSVCTVTVKARKPGASALTVANAGNVGDTYDLAVISAPAGWAATVAPASLSLDRGASGQATLTFKPTGKTASGTYPVIVDASSQSAEDVHDAVTISVVVR